eukprot:TRINITY_DN17807_c0_g1_i1.p1 TRINITY_DN17807_c0_g1~~TRINITY_DN17807_c0_g1_i1.p1  ORF type:complete len:394 (-),score=41.24 TRINITY_DN17807_c0_g1_i1:35-1216(-)
MAWTTDQIVSFVVPLRDLEYTFCYYIAYFFDGNVGSCRSSLNKRVSSALLAAVIPLLYRVFQCLRKVWDHKRLWDVDIWNTIKYLISITTAFLAYFLRSTNGSVILLSLWITCAAISTLYSFYFDLKFDWGFLESNSKYPLLRRDMSFRSPYIYYTAIASNLLLRCAWVLSISQDIVSALKIPSGFFTLIIGFLEMLRRSIWNFFRLEKEHLVNAKAFNAVQTISLPFTDIEYEGRDGDEILLELMRDIETKDKTRSIRIERNGGDTDRNSDNPNRNLLDVVKSRLTLQGEGEPDRATGENIGYPPSVEVSLDVNLAVAWTLKKLQGKMSVEQMAECKAYANRMKKWARQRNTSAFTLRRSAVPVSSPTFIRQVPEADAVSYTHLTLPTIYSV